MGNNCCQNHTETAPETTLVQVREIKVAEKAQQQEKEAVVEPDQPLPPTSGALKGSQDKLAPGSRVRIDPSVLLLKVPSTSENNPRSAEHLVKQKSQPSDPAMRSKQWVQSGEMPPQGLRERVNRKSNIAFLVTDNVIPKKTIHRAPSGFPEPLDSEGSESSAETDGGTLTIAPKHR